MKILIIDNYDSFTYNLVHIVEEFTDDYKVFRNDEISLEEVNNYKKVLFSPGPGLPKDAGLMPAIIKHYHKQKPMLGVCLGMQAMAEYFGGKLYNLPTVLHGVETTVKVVSTNSKLFQNVPKKFQAGLYHSWAVDASSIGSELMITAENPEKVVMAMEHTKWPICGVQFHPESVMTSIGKKLIENWLTNY